MANIDWPEAAIIFVEIACVVFWLWMVYAFFKEGRVAPKMRPLWIVGFVFFGLVTSIAYFFLHYTKDD